MLAADKLLLRSTVKQRAIQLREKELTLFNDNSISVHCAIQGAVPIHTKEGSYHWTASNGEISILHPLKEGCVRSLQRVLLDSELAKWRAAHVTVQRIRVSDISLDPA